MIRRLFRTIIIAVLIVFAAYMIISNIAFFQTFKGSLSRMTIIDADSGHDLDDLFAIARALTDKDMEVIGLISSQWNFHANAPDSSVRISQSTHEQILDKMNLTSLPHPAGSPGMLRIRDGIPVPEPSGGAKFIIDNAHGMPSGERMKVIVLGPSTNLASAILLDPGIIPKLDCYLVGLKYDPMQKAWNKNEFNVRNDLDAIDIILNTENLDVTIMPANLAENLKINRMEAEEFLINRGDIWNWILENWSKYYPGLQECMMQDVALIEAILHPRFATLKQLYPPPENTRRKINVYTKIKTDAMIKDFRKAAGE